MLYKIQKLYQSILFYFRLYGFTGGIKFAIGLLKSGVEKIYCFDLNTDKFNKSLINSELKFQIIENENQFNNIYEDYVNIKGRLLANEDKKRIMCKKELLGVIYKDDCLAGWGWIKLGVLKYGNNKLSQNECIIHKCRTIRTVRRQKVYSTLLIAFLTELKLRDIKKAFIGAKEFNIASLAAIEKVGFKFVEKFNSGNFFVRTVNHLKGNRTKVIKSD